MLTKQKKALEKKLKSDHYEELLDKHQGDGRKTWEILKEITRSKDPPHDKFPANMDISKANSFNKYFATVGKRALETLGVQIQEFQPTVTDGFAFTEETPLSIKRIIDDLKTNVAVGHDNLPAKIYKGISGALTPSICELVNLSYRTATFPQTLKHATVKPIFKDKGTQEDPQFYRPLSILC